MMTVYEIAARNKKVAALVATFREKGITSFAVEGLNHDSWLHYAACAKVNLPSEETRRLVVAQLKTLESAQRIDYDDHSPTGHEALDPAFDDRKGDSL